MRWQGFENQIQLTTVPFSVKKNTGKAVIATGFVVAVPSKKRKNSNVLVLVTNAHVFKGVEGKLILTFNDAGNVPAKPNSWRKQDIELDLKSGNILEDQSGSDLAGMAVAGLPGLHFALRTIPVSMFSDFREDDLMIGSDVWFAGYPNGVLDELHNLPITRFGRISTSPKVDFNGTSTFFVDAQVFGGQSGSPVFYKSPKGMKFVGVVSANIAGIQQANLPGPITFPQVIGLGNIIKATQVLRFVEHVRDISEL
jgi:hypothetical protein